MLKSTTSILQSEPCIGWNKISIFTKQRLQCYYPASSSLVDAYYPWSHLVGSEISVHECQLDCAKRSPLLQKSKIRLTIYCIILQLLNLPSFLLPTLACGKSTHLVRHKYTVHLPVWESDFHIFISHSSGLPSTTILNSAKLHNLRP
jgi:hypothetical protein